MASYNPTSLTPSLFTEVPVLSQESERSCICVIGISNLSISTIFLLNVWNFSYSVIIFYHFIIGCKNIYDDVPANRASKRNIARRNNTALGPEDRLKLFSQLWIWVENTKKNNEQIKIKRQWLRPWGTSEIHGSFHGSPSPLAMHRMNPLSKALLCTTLDSVNPVLYPSIDAILCVKHASNKRYC